MRIYNAHMKPARKVRTNVTLRADLVKRAKARKMNLSEVCERALEAELRRRDREAWLAENEEAIDDYNRWIAKHGMFSDGRRLF
jgi:antitoxin CcdA